MANWLGCGLEAVYEQIPAGLVWECFDWALAEQQLRTLEAVQPSTRKDAKKLQALKDSISEVFMVPQTEEEKKETAGHALEAFFKRVQLGG